MKYDNEYEIRVFGLKHAGQHAVINWIATLFDEPVYFFNNCGWHRDPHKTKRTRGTRKGTKLENIFVNLPKMRWASDEEIDSVKYKPKKCLMYSYENAYVDRVYGKGSGSGKPATPLGTIGASKNVFDVLILRDIFNLSSSALKNTNRNWQGNVQAGDDKDLSMLDWKNYKERDKIRQRYALAAKEFLGETNYLKNKICISFNDWFLSKEYRRLTASKFGLPNNEVSIDVVAGVGNRGSRFDDFEYDGKAREMKVLERWKHFKDNKVFWKVISKMKDEVDLSNKIFGKIPETEKYYE